MLEHLRAGIAAGSASEEAYAAFLDRLVFADAGDGGDAGNAGDGGDCGTWMAMPEARSEDLRFAGLREALADVCPAPESSTTVKDMDAEPGPGRSAAAGEAAAPAPPERGGARARISVSKAAQPRRDPAPALTGFDRLAGQGVFPGGAWRLAFAEEARADQRLLRLGSGRFALYAGQFHSSLERTRLGFVAGGRFYAGRSGVSGVAGPWEARSSALDGMAVSARAGRWIAEAAGAWNRINPRAGEAGPGTDALLYQLGMALPARVSPRSASRRRESAGTPAGLGLRAQILHLRGESNLPGGADPVDLSVAGLGLEGAWTGFARWSLGLAGSRIGPPPGLQGESGFGGAGGYAEAALSSLPEDSASWRLEARQATEAWANPLQSPRGSLRDTVGGWILPGRGEGAAAVRGCFPFAARGAWSLALRPGLEAGWSSAGGLLAQSGALGLLQKWGAWTGETGTALRWRGSATASAAEGQALAGETALPDDPGGRTAMAAMGWGQNLAWHQGIWKAKAAFTWKGGGYAGTLPAPLGLEAGRSARPRRNAGPGSGSGSDSDSDSDKISRQSSGNEGTWSVAVLTGDIRNPGRYLRADVRESWELGGKLKAELAIRLPWTPEEPVAGLSYQLRLEAAL